MSKFGIIVNVDKCVGCHACAIACKEENRVAPGIPEVMRAAALRHSPDAMLSRGIAGLRGGTLIINLPGSEVPATSSLAAIINSLKPGIDRLRRPN